MLAEFPWPWVVVAALVFEAFAAWPKRLAHPVVAIGAIISVMERRWNKPVHSAKQLRLLGVAAVVILLVLTIAVGAFLHWLTSMLPALYAGLILALIGSVGMAAGSLYRHVSAILRPLRDSDLSAARTAVGMIVGRDTDNMTEQDVAAAALESLAESFNDGVVAPVFWFCLGGLPGLFAYKAINTADSMIGHMEIRWRYFGWAAAKTDDLMNWIPARIAGAIIIFAGMMATSLSRAFGVMVRHAPLHPSPNAGWPEAAMAGVLGIGLGGPVSYDGQVKPRPALGYGPPPTSSSLQAGMAVYVRAVVILALFLVLGGGLCLL